MYDRLILIFINDVYRWLNLSDYDIDFIVEIMIIL